MEFLAPSGWLSDAVILGQVALAMALGGLIGLEREVHNKPAGFRTHMLLAGAAALLVGLGVPLLREYATDVGPGLVRADPNRIVEAVVTGISFLGAGTIFRAGKRGPVEGLTTAASLLMSGGVGIAVALGHVMLAVAVTALVLLVLRAMGFVERRLRRRPPSLE